MNFNNEGINSHIPIFGGVKKTGATSVAPVDIRMKVIISRSCR